MSWLRSSLHYRVAPALQSRCTGFSTSSEGRTRTRDCTSDYRCRIRFAVVFGPLYRRVWRPGGTKNTVGAKKNASFGGTRALPETSGFTLLEVLVALTVLAIGTSLALSLISGSLGNIRKVQLKTRTVEHAEAVMELALLDDANNQPRTFTGDFEDGTRWTVRIENYEMPIPEGLQSRSSPQNMPVKLLAYTVEMFSPDSRSSDYRLQTLKLVKTTPEDQRTRIQ